MNIKWQDIAMLFVAAFVLGLLLAEHGGTKSQDTICERELVRARPDTIREVIEVPLRPLKILATQNHFRTLVLHDTITNAACLDTLLTCDTTASAPDTLSICYAQHAFALSLGLAPRKRSVTIPYLARDTFYWRDDSILVEPAPPRAWYDDALAIIIAIAAGIIVGKL